ncbi:hypothetical protein CCB80_03210 [Armatimonadetes bacterium Uphvl-Ar1]|nr:hypothetical protein CCB80_03210 [Armatimonadetes bacterium Uphvl-Ar1]
MLLLVLSREAAVAELARRRFAADPVLYAERVLGVKYTPDQEDIARSIVDNRRVMVIASHSVGKSMIMGGLTNWHYDVHDPGITITTAPTKNQVEDVLWKEVRRQRGNRPGLMPKAPRMESSAEHFAVGLTASKSDAFQGRHEANVMIVFDEAVGVDAPFWDAAEGMMTSDERRLVAIMNPTDVSSRAYEEFCSGRWHIIQISALNHPNIEAQLRGEPPPFPAAVSLKWVEEKIESWCTPLGQSPHTEEDFEWPPESGVWYRPGPLFESRVMGRWPSQATNSVWSNAAWQACLIQKPIPQAALAIGCDVARFGDDFTSIHVRRGRASLYHFTVNGWRTGQIVGELKKLAKLFCEDFEDPRNIMIAVDDDGIGGGVVDGLVEGGYFVLPMNGGAVPRVPDDYPNVRSEAWFCSAELAGRGEIDVSRLSKEHQQLLMTQLLAPTWQLDSSGRRVVEKKELTKKRIKRSPDDADAFNLCHYARPTTSFSFEVIG